MQHLTHNKLVEQNDTKQRNKHDNSCEYFVLLYMWVVGVMMLELDSADKEVCFSEHDEVEGDCDYGKE